MKIVHQLELQLIGLRFIQLGFMKVDIVSQQFIPSKSVVVLKNSFMNYNQLN